MGGADEPTLTVPALAAPRGTTDCHIHIYGSTAEYPAAPTAPYPPPYSPVARYRAVMRRLGVERAVVVQPAAYGTNNRCTMDAVAELGAAARAVVVVHPLTDRAHIRRLHDRGARGARFFMLRGTVMTWNMLAPVARLIADFGWHVQLQFDGRDLPHHANAIRALPCPAVIDHNGKFLEPVAPDHQAVQTLLQLLETGRVWVKASAPYETSRSGPPFYDDVGKIARTLIAAAPDRIVWATNWPHGAQSVKPDDAALLDVLLDWAPDQSVRHRILVDNPEKLYGFERVTQVAR